MSKKKPTKHKATEERTTLLFFFPKTEKHQRSRSLRRQWNVHTRGERARETARETTREERRPSGYQSHPDISPRDGQRPVTSHVRLSTPSGHKSEGIVRENSVRLPTMFGIRPVRLPSRGRRASGYRLPIRAIRGNGTPKDGQAGRRAGASVVFFVELQTLVTGGWFCTGFLGERCEFLHFGGRCIIGLSLLLVSISLRSAYTDSATFSGRIFQRAQFKLSFRGFINFCNSLIHVFQCFCWFRIGLKCDA